MKKPTLSVVLPTYNCHQLIERHLATMESWSDIADEIIVVDSRSNDGTLEKIREKLRHANLTIIERDRGLYESWNAGIKLTKGDWVYISTAGDTINREHLIHLMETGNNCSADIVVSSPLFVDEGGNPVINQLIWPPEKIINYLKLNRPTTLRPENALMFAIIHAPGCILGSSASNIYRGSEIRKRPLPVNFSGAGDTAWVLKNADSLKICFTPIKGSAFTIHPKQDGPCTKKRNEIIELIYEEMGAACGRLSRLPALLIHEKLLLDYSILSYKTNVIWNERRHCRREIRNSKLEIVKWAELNFLYLKHRVKLAFLRKKMRALANFNLKA